MVVIVDKMAFSVSMWINCGKVLWGIRKFQSFVSVMYDIPGRKEWNNELPIPGISW